MQICQKCLALLHPGYAGTGSTLCENCWTTQLAELQIEGRIVRYAYLQSIKDNVPARFKQPDAA